MAAPTYDIATWHPEAPGLDMQRTNGHADPVPAEGQLWCRYSEVLDLVMQVQYETRRRVVEAILAGKQP
ncbi:hypothetical protein AWB80_07534 [Caballeronia pedi]|uniref:Uncharacterized protein n=1 Tax=Caballeronia pedi TaxID=1777141 RepID=A0A158DV44_9BURK|nr:hypothetical protein [Caballeronia pedi]SAK98491.1 hypothetical protein AWB80_07534 [Caballeronia pedi]